MALSHTAPCPSSLQGTSECSEDGLQAHAHLHGVNTQYTQRCLTGADNSPVARHFSIQKVACVAMVVVHLATKKHKCPAGADSIAWHSTLNQTQNVSQALTHLQGFWTYT